MNTRSPRIKRLGAWAARISAEDLRRFIVILLPYVFLIVVVWLSQKEFIRNVQIFQYIYSWHIFGLLSVLSEALTNAFVILRGMLLTIFVVAVLAWLRLFLRERATQKSESQR